jgi:hypothetical protein
LWPQALLATFLLVLCHRCYLTSARAAASTDKAQTNAIVSGETAWRIAVGVGLANAIVTVFVLVARIATGRDWCVVFDSELLVIFFSSIRLPFVSSFLFNSSLIGDIDPYVLCFPSLGHLMYD